MTIARGDGVPFGRLGEDVRGEALLGEEAAHDAERFEPLRGGLRREDG